MKEFTTTLGVNIDHVATLRQARRTPYPDFGGAIEAVERAGADGVTMHLREDRRHVQDADVHAAREKITTHLNLEMAPTREMLAIALDVRPDYCCLVPEKREELTTEGGLDVAAHAGRIGEVCAALAEAGILVSLFIEPAPEVIDRAAALGAPIVELHTGEYALAGGDERRRQLRRIEQAAAHAARAGLQPNAGHGLHRGNVRAVAAIAAVAELNIGHSIVADAVFVGLEEAVRRMRAAMRGE
ncbi:MAG: pyridoxine 5'-phosphate synthase [Gammaproteobacteria bacterium]|nr:pyridoxine 5'-phosphate synthase [Gammaproteobacteria bacterium]MDD9868954.1 pyridoxine 5'-phosphate synthase [Gammaproteobacteria bacterium]